MAGHPSLQAGWIDRPHRRFELGDLPLESGETLRDAFVSYVVHGDEARLHEAPVSIRDRMMIGAGYGRPAAFRSATCWGLAITLM